MINPTDLPDDIELLKAIVLRQQDQNARLEKLVADFKRALFGAKSEKANPEQYELAFEDIETAIESVHANTPTTCRCIAKLKSMRDRVLILIAPHWHRGSAKLSMS